MYVRHFIDAYIRPKSKMTYNLACGFDEGLAQSGRKFGARLETHVNAPEKRTYLLQSGMSRWLLSSGTLPATTA